MEAKEQRLAWSPSLRLETASQQDFLGSLAGERQFPAARNLSANFFSFRSDGVQETLARYDNLIKACKGDPDAWELAGKACVPL